MLNSSIVTLHITLQSSPAQHQQQHHHHHRTNSENQLGSKLRFHISSVHNGKSVRNSVLCCSSTCQQEGINLPPWGNIQKTQNAHTLKSLDSRKFASQLKPKLHFLEENDQEILSKRLLVLSRSNKVTSAFELYMSMEVSGLRPNPHACNSLISCLLRNGCFDDSFKVFDIMRKNSNENVTGHTCSLILKAIGTTRGFDSALHMFMELQSQDARSFDAITYNTMISLCGKANNWVEAERTWKLLKENRHKGTLVTYSLLVSIFVRCGQNELACDAYNEMIRNGLEPCEDTMKAIISACTKEGKWDFALSVFHSMLNTGFNPNIIAYNALINSLGKSGEVKLAFRVFNLMRSSGHSPDEYTWNALLCALNRADRYGDALNLFESIKRDKSSKLNPHLYNTALISCQRLGLWGRSLQILWQMEASGLSPSTASYNLVLGACEAARKPKVSLQVYEQMVHKKCTPDTFTYLSLVRACIWGSLWSEVNEIFDHVTPNVSLYNAIIHGMCLQGKVIEAKKLYAKMRESGLKPDGKTWALMIQNLKGDSVRNTHRRWRP